MGSWINNSFLYWIIDLLVKEYGTLLQEKIENVNIHWNKNNQQHRPHIWQQLHNIQ